MQILLTVSYDGTNYAGWQRQENAIAVQEKVEDALSELLARPIVVRAASRTDAGVHALGQRAVFSAPDLRVPLDKLPKVLCGLLPNDISITAAEAVPEDFNPRFNAKEKTYTYSIFNAPYPNPLLARQSAFVPEKLDMFAMQEAAKSFIGKHDFAAFCATGSSAKTTTREIMACDVIRNTAYTPSLIQPKDNSNLQHHGLIALTITGNAFLYNMVRIIAGTILYTGLGKIPPDAIPDIIASKDRTKAGKTMPPQGLVLMEVCYAPKHFNTMLG
ncbi:MAG: tRNA pseudouridine(38-40) synthase TruA [Defluviitaleaceae bacterium]|nr:tRNA pseudouridine(38-40) synthase TruA [Defluviitaleaceae bacterium]